jgi:hypothetical protein
MPRLVLAFALLLALSTAGWANMAPGNWASQRVQFAPTTGPGFTRRPSSDDNIWATQTATQPNATRNANLAAQPPASAPASQPASQPHAAGDSHPLGFALSGLLVTAMLIGGGLLLARRGRRGH